MRVIAGQDPITGEAVERSPLNLLRAFMQLSEAGAEKLRRMEETGTLQRAANWIGGAIARLTRNVRAIRNGFVRLWRSVTIQNLLNPIRTFSEIYQTFAEPVGDILSFLVEVGVQVLKFIKDALLSRLSAFARTLPGYPLLTVILGRDPFTGENVPRTATNFVRGFLSLLPNGEERFRNLQESGALDRAFAWLGAEVEKLDLSWATIRELFLTAWRSLSIRDLANPIAAFRRMVNLFREPVGRILRFAGAVGMKILEFVFEGVMGAGGARVLNILKRARATFLTIIRDPIGFLGNLINAVVQGFRQFSANILTHLASGLVGWLFGALQGAGLQLPERFDLRGIISLVLQILGLTYDRIRPRLVRVLGERTVSILERTFEFLRILVTEGPAGAWRKIVEFAGNLRDQVMEGIRNWVITRVVTAAVMRLATMFNPVGAALQAILAIYNTIMFFIERINQILALVESITNSIASIAAGNISAAANFVEQTMARTLPVIISFLARLLGLGNISGAIRRIIQRIRRPIDRAIDRVIQWIVRQARRLVRGGRGGAGREDTTRVKQQAHRDLGQAFRGRKLRQISEVDAIVNRVFQRYRRQGLKRIDVRADPRDRRGRVVFALSASEALELVTSVDELITDVTPEQQEMLTVAKQTSYATLSVNGRQKDRISYSRKPTQSEVANNEDLHGHSEERIVKGGTWQSELRGAAERAAGSEGEEPQGSTVAITINRSPCSSICVPALSAALGNFENSVAPNVQDGRRNETGNLVDWIKSKVRFVLSALGLYKGRFGATTSSDVASLARAGWHPPRREPCGW